MQPPKFGIWLSELKWALQSLEHRGSAGPTAAHASTNGISHPGYLAYQLISGPDYAWRAALVKSSTRPPARHADRSQLVAFTTAFVGERTSWHPKLQLLVSQSSNSLSKCAVNANLNGFSNFRNRQIWSAKRLASLTGCTVCTMCAWM